MIVVLTTPRRPQYLGATLRDLDACGGADHPGRKIVAVDGPIRDLLRLRCVPSSWHVVQVGPGGRGNREAFSMICKLAAADQAGGDLLFFEDDVTGCKNALLALELIEVPDDCGFIQAFDHRNLLAGQLTPLLLRVAADDPAVLGFWGNQALKIPHRTLMHLAQQPNDRYVAGVAADPTQERSLTFGGDMWLGAYAASSSAPWKFYALIAPSLFQHVGGVSAINPQWRLTPGQWRIAKNWRADFDGLELASALSLGKVHAATGVE